MDKKYTIVLLHGWKKTSKSLYVFKERLNRYANLLFIDFPILINQRPLNIDDYVELLHEKIKTLDNVILLGHSFGGKIASFYALKYEIKGMILIAPSTYIKKDFKTKIMLFLNRICNKLKLKKPKFLKGSSDYQSLNGLEKITFKNVLKYLDKKDLKKINIEVLIFGFNKDNQVKVSDLKYLNTHIKKSKLNIFLGDHFGYFENLDEISLLIGDYLNEID